MAGGCILVLPCSPEEFGDKRFLLKSIAYNATARSDMFTLPCSRRGPSPLRPACPFRIM